jgi:hypothetical protein
MDQTQSNSRPNLQTTIRTLLLAGFSIENNQRQPTHTEIYCSAPILGAHVPLLVAVSEEDELPPSILPHIQLSATRSGRTLVIVANCAGENQLAWDDFLDRFGGAVPSWRALDDTYLSKLDTASKNGRPEDFTGEPWRLFEQLVADGLEFAFGRKVRRLGAAKRGQKVSDMIALLPEASVLIVDAKATATSFDAAIHHLRPLAEYTKNQKDRQRGFADVFGALVVARAFDQDAASLLSISREFTSQSGVPVAFLEVTTLAYLVQRLRIEPTLRVGIRWRFLFAGGLVGRQLFDSEVASLKAERY